MKHEHRRELRARVYDACYGHCCYCGNELPATEFTLDHVTPLCRGGRTVSTNLVVCCQKCNWLKLSRPLDEFLRIQPDAARHFVRWAFSVPRLIRAGAALLATKAA